MIKKTINELKNMHFSILGAGKSGIAAAKLSKFYNLNFLLSESRNMQVDLKDNFNIETGGHSKQIFDSDFVIKSPGISNDTSIIKEINNKSIPIISEVEFASWFTKSPVIGITGSNGKSTTVKLIHEVMSKSSYKSLLGGNIGTPFSENVYKEITKEYIDVIHILELSSFQLEHIFNLSLDVGCILNITKDHLDRYKDFNHYIDSKLNIINAVKNDGKIICNADDKILKNRINGKRNIVKFSLDNEEIKEIKSTEIHLKGIHNLMNISAALEISKFFNVKFDSFKETIKSFKPLEHRLEYVCKKNDTLVYNDSKATNVDSMKVAIDSFNKQIIIIVGGLDKGKSDIAKVIESQGKKITHVICYGQSGKDIFDKLSQSTDSEYYIKFDDAVKSAILQIDKGEVLLLSPGCASYDQFSSYIERGNTFKEIVLGLS